MKISKTTILTLCSFIFIANLFAQHPKIERVEPPFWWVGMKNTEVQLLIYGKDISSTRPEIKNKNVILKESILVSNKDYIFLNLEILPQAKPGKFEIEFSYSKRKKITYNYELKKRESKRLGIDKSDVIYLLMPDRFANGDVTNDEVKDLYEKADKKTQYSRYGGDIKGVINHLDYIEEAGFTSIWLNPVFENNAKNGSYHGYSITDFYKIDARLGTNELYKEFIDKCHKKGMKVVMDMIFNHCGKQHWWMENLPEKDWVHNFDKFTQTSFKAMSINDPYASDYDLKIMEKGWFTSEMPDLNQQNPLVEKYLIQNSIWWIEYSAIDGIRMDTYPYPEKNMMTRWNKAVEKEYPNYFIVGEVWVDNSVPWTAYWGKDANNSDGFNSNLASLTDFPINGALTNSFKKDGSIMELYKTLTQDFLYTRPDMNVTFVDNHDISRFYTTIGENTDKLKLSMVALLTLRGIPQIYYGTEILMKADKSDGDGKLREPFPGGWQGDKADCFTEKGRNKEQNEVFNYLKTILDWRKKSEVIKNGKLKHFMPIDELYVYFRYTDGKAIMVVINNKNEDKTFETTRYNEMLSDYTKGVDIITKKSISLNKISVKANTALIIELEK